MNCWNCKQKLPPFPSPIPFRATCEYCLAWLHVCVNCKYYSPGKPNSCLVPGTEAVADREKANLCEEFQWQSIEAKRPNEEVKDVEQRLFGDSSDSSQTPSFDDLFS